MFRLTEFGKQLHQGRVDFLRTNGMDRWFGGVHVTGRESAWRWDPDWGCLVAGGQG